MAFARSDAGGHVRWVLGGSGDGSRSGRAVVGCVE